MRIRVVKSAGYAVISATTGYLKLYHGPEFIVANLNSVLGKAEEIQVYLNEARAMGVKVLAPSINSSNPEFKLEGDAIRVGLMGLKNLGKISQEIIAHRTSPWKTIEDFMFSLVDTIDKRAFESLALAGALDEFGVPRKVLSEKSEDVSAFLQKMRKYSSSEDGALPEVDNLYVRLNKVDLSGTEEFSRQELLANELERCGVYVSGHPLDGLSDYYINKHILPINAIKAQQSEELAEGEDLDTDNDGYGKSPYEDETVNICGTAASIKQITTKKGDLMLMMRIEDKDTDVSVTVFPKVFKAFMNGNAIQNAQKMRDLSNGIIMVNGRVETDSWGTKIIANSIAIVDENLMSGVTPAVWVNTDTKERKEELINWVASQPAEEDGKGTQVIAYYQLSKGQNAMVVKNIKLSLASFLELKDNFVVKSNKAYSETELDKKGQAIVKGDWSEIVL